MLDWIFSPRRNRNKTKTRESWKPLSLESLEDRTTPSTLVVGADAGGSPLVEIYDTAGTLQSSFLAYDSRFTGGVHVATGDINGDGVQDIITGAGAGGGPHVRVFSGADGSDLQSFFAYDPNFGGGVNVASGDVNGDGFDDVITGAGAGGGPHVRVFSGADGSDLQSFFAYDPNFGGGVNVASGDVDGDGFDDVITGAGAGGGPHVRVFSGADGSDLQSFFAYDPNFGGGVFVASGDLNNNGFADIITGAGAGGGPHVRAFDGGGAGTLADFFAFDAAFTGGTRVSSVNLDGLGTNGLVVGTGPGSPPTVRTFTLDPLGQVNEFTALDAAFSGGISVGSTILGNQAPSFTAGPDETVLEDAEPQTVTGWATDIQPGPSTEAGQILTFHVSTDNDALFAELPAIAATTGDLTYTLAEDANGSATVTVVLADDGGTANGGVDTSDPQTFTINVTPVNDAPTFTLGDDQTVTAVAGISQPKSNFAASFVTGRNPDSGQSFTATDDVVNLSTISFGFHKSNTRFRSPEMVVRLYQGVGFSGTLLDEVTQTVSRDTPTGTLVSFDFSGNTLTSGEVYSFSIGVTQTGFVAGGLREQFANVYSEGTRLLSSGNPTSGRDLMFEVAGTSAMQTVTQFVTNTSTGPVDESGQSHSFNVTTNNDRLFTVLPSIDANGTLTYAPSVGATGNATVTLEAIDDGGTANGGIDTQTQTFTITVT